jgi:hypothetical protein
MKLHIQVELTNEQMQAALAKLFQWPDDAAGLDNMLYTIEHGVGIHLVSAAIVAALAPEVLNDLETIRELPRGSKEFQEIQSKYFKEP